MSSTPQIYVRRTSGLVREISAWDALIYNVLIMAPTAVYVYGVWAMGIFPGVHLPATVFIAMAISIVVGLYYAFMSAVMPRTGGDYIWISRLIHPALGFMMNFFLFAVLLAVAGSYVPWFTQWAAAPLLEVMGMGEVAAAINDPVNMFIIGVVYYLLIAALMSRGVRATKIAFWAFFVTIAVGFLTYVFSMVFMGVEGFKAAFEASTGLSYSEIIQKALDNGMPGGFLLGATFSGVMFTILNFLGFNSSVYISGEIKEVRKSQLIAIVGAVLVFGLITWLVYQATYVGMGEKFIAALSYLYTNVPDAYPLGTDPFFHLIAKLVLSPQAFALVALGFGAMTLSAILVYIFTTVRLMFAWAFDRVIPTFFSNVDPKTGTPYVALIAVSAIAILFQYLWLFTPYMGYFAFIVLGWGIMNAIASLAGMVLPYKRKDLFELAPAIARRSVGGVPVLTILAVLSFIISLWLAWVGTQPATIGEMRPEYIYFLAGIYLLGLAIYAVSSIYHRAKGIPLELAFKELPPA